MIIGAGSLKSDFSASEELDYARELAELERITQEEPPPPECVLPQLK